MKPTWSVVQELQALLVEERLGGGPGKFQPVQSPPSSKRYTFDCVLWAECSHGWHGGEIESVSFAAT